MTVCVKSFLSDVGGGYDWESHEKYDMAPVKAPTGDVQIKNKIKNK